MTDIVQRRARPVTPDGRYFVAGGCLFRRNDPALSPDAVKRLTFELIAARSEEMHARRRDDAAGLAAARKKVDAVKTSLGQRGPPWWKDGAPDVSRQKASGTGYAAWLASLVDRAPER